MHSLRNTVENTDRSLFTDYSLLVPVCTLKWKTPKIVHLRTSLWDEIKWPGCRFGWLTKLLYCTSTLLLVIVLDMLAHVITHHSTVSHLQANTLGGMSTAVPLHATRVFLLWHLHAMLDGYLKCWPLGAEHCIFLFLLQQRRWGLLYYLRDNGALYLAVKSLLTYSNHLLCPLGALDV